MTLLATDASKTSGYGEEEGQAPMDNEWHSQEDNVWEKSDESVEEEIEHPMWGWGVPRCLQLPLCFACSRRLFLLNDFFLWESLRLCTQRLFVSIRLIH